MLWATKTTKLTWTICWEHQGNAWTTLWLYIAYSPLWAWRNRVKFKRCFKWQSTPISLQYSACELWGLESVMKRIRMVHRTRYLMLLAAKPTTLLGSKEGLVIQLNLDQQLEMVLRSKEKWMRGSSHGEPEPWWYYLHYTKHPQLCCPALGKKESVPFISAVIMVAMGFSHPVS